MSGYCGNKCDFYGCPVGGDIWHLKIIKN
jgi:hypothetical protein